MLSSNLILNLFIHLNKPSPLKQNILMENNAGSETPQNNSAFENKKPEKKKNSALGWISLLVSLWFVINGCMRVSEGSTGWGLILILLGGGGFIYKLYELTKSNE